MGKKNVELIDRSLKGEKIDGDFYGSAATGPFLRNNFRSSDNFQNLIAKRSPELSVFLFGERSDITFRSDNQIRRP
jgi:hypothetical protein